MSKRGANIVLSFASLIAGGLLYVLFRSHSYVSLLFADIPLVAQLRDYFSPLSNDLLKYYLPDFLWGFSLCCGLQAIGGSSNRNVVICGSLTLCCGVLWEVMQYIQIVGGTGDLVDIAMYLLASFIGTTINLRRNE